ncbi:hypothetical protein CUMW_191190 [Citrus unshiu]|uniref:Uncharacterized protein n=1 Tax=Citrus unshiu TaxID=55188 RepID=A0A2H5Q3X5_CITUN|nr:hypothetical protein CUMW_191190 [Citrus unshiu]
MILSNLWHSDLEKSFYVSLAAWKKLEDLINVFEVFISQLHLYHNPYSLLNEEAAGVITQLYYSYSKSERQSSFSI